MTMQFTCPHCQNLFEVDAKAAGQTVICPYCQRGLVLPRTAAGKPKSRSGRGQMLVLPGVALFLVAMYFVGVQMRLWPGPDLGSFGVHLPGSRAAPVTVHKAWTAGELSSGLGITRSTISLSKTARDRGMGFLVIKMTLDASVLDVRRLDEKEVKEMEDGKPESMPKDADWHRYTLKSGQFRVLKPDGESVLADGFGSTFGDGYSQVSSSVVSTVQKPKSVELTPFFVIAIGPDDLKGLKFQFKDEPAVPFTVAEPQK